MIIVLTCWVKEAQKYEREGRGIEIIQPSKKNVILGVILLVIYILFKIFYFDRLS
jgi:hypothetical protein